MGHDDSFISSAIRHNSLSDSSAKMIEKITGIKVERFKAPEIISPKKRTTREWIKIDSDKLKSIITLKSETIKSFCLEKQIPDYTLYTALKDSRMTYSFIKKLEILGGIPFEEYQIEDKPKAFVKSRQEISQERLSDSLLEQLKINGQYLLEINQSLKGLCKALDVEE